MTKMKLQEITVKLGRIPTFSEFVMAQDEANDAFGQVVPTQNNVTPSYYNANSMDKMSMMQPDQLASLVAQRFSALRKNPQQPQAKSWWTLNFGTNIVKLLLQKGVIVDQDPMNGASYTFPLASKFGQVGSAFSALPPNHPMINGNSKPLGQ